MTTPRTLILAVDGGQSSTLAMVATTDGKIISSGFAGPSNHVDEPGGPERLRGAIDKSTGEALAKISAERDAVAGICLGMTGGADMAGEHARERFAGSNVQAYYDFVTALAGASLAQPGIVVIGGTGAVSYGRLADGREVKAGGWGFVMGDEGSGYDIGRHALQLATQAYDGRIEHTQLVERVPAQLGVADIWGVQQLIYSGQMERPEIARLTVSVMAGAEAGDEACQRILASAGRDLADIAIAAGRKLGVLGQPIGVYPTGGIFTAGHRIRAAFEQSIAEREPTMTVHSPAFPPIGGGLLLALKAVNGELTETVINNLRETFPQAASSKHQQREQQG
ncbi:MAG: hypothetical protein LCI00_30295 [Chloroflexi bacterium]|nr:hypothetical protein [Chloroflexota bacterium]MCC6893227.1 hypothetical protein [Anaerolineae bacterium]